MQMRYDLLVCYIAMAALSFIALILPIPVPVHMIVMTTLIIYVGCHLGAQSTKESQSESGQKQETLGRSDVYLFPIIGSCVLFSLYLVFKIFPRALMVGLFKFYFMLGGIWVVAHRINMIAIGCCSEEQEQKARGFKVPLPLQGLNNGLRPVVEQINKIKAQISTALEPAKPHLAQIPKAFQALELFIIEKVDGKEAADKARAQAEAEQNGSGTPESPSSQNQSVQTTPSSNPIDWFPDVITFDGIAAISFGSAVGIAILYLLTNHWIFNNIFGICFSLQAIESINIGSYMNGAILLSGLFFYDIFWVFGTDVMVTVAKSVDAPIKLLFPRGEQPAMLGLGDIVIPGIFIALILRFDMYLARPFNHRDVNAKPLGPLNNIINKIGSLSFITVATDYFNLVMIGYVFGLFTTVSVMYLFKAAQPALLYLVPACLLFTAGIAAALGQDEFNKLVNFVDQPDKQEPQSPTPAPVPTPASPIKSD